MKTGRKTGRTYEDLDRKLKTMYPDNIYQEAESRYLQSILKKKLHSNDQLVSDEELKQIF